MINRSIVWLTAATTLFSCLLVLPPAAWSRVLEDGDKTYLVDRTGERWDISQAVSIGFEPRYFEFGIGRHAFRTLDDTHWQSETAGANGYTRVIGVADNEDAHAYSVAKLRYHEIANTHLGHRAIAAGY